MNYKRYYRYFREIVPIHQAFQRCVAKGLTAFQLKVVALVFMTLDHLASFGFEITVVAKYSLILRTVGRVAAPLFLFVLIQSVQHTKSKTRFLLRLYVASVCIGLLDTAMNFFAGEILGYRTLENIIFTFFYVILYVILIEQLISAYKKRDTRFLFRILLIFTITLFPTIFFDAIYSAVPVGSSIAYRFLFQGLRESFIPSFYDVDYGIGFILLGIFLYFARTKKRQCYTFMFFCLFCILGAFIKRWISAISYFSFWGFVSIFFDFFQCRMILALPFMMLYNGERGRTYKYFFYWYYPVHRQIIVIISALIA